MIKIEKMRLIYLTLRPKCRKMKKRFFNLVISTKKRKKQKLKDIVIKKREREREEIKHVVQHRRVSKRSLSRRREQVEPAAIGGV